jgi:hypothetical protein
VTDNHLPAALAASGVPPAEVSYALDLAEQLTAAHRQLVTLGWCGVPSHLADRPPQPDDRLWRIPLGGWLSAAVLASCAVGGALFVTAPDRQTGVLPWTDGATPLAGSPSATGGHRKNLPVPSAAPSPTSTPPGPSTGLPPTSPATRSLSFSLAAATLPASSSPSSASRSETDHRPSVSVVSVPARATGGSAPASTATTSTTPPAPQPTAGPATSTPGRTRTPPAPAGHPHPTTDPGGSTPTPPAIPPGSTPNTPPTTSPPPQPAPAPSDHDEGAKPGDHGKSCDHHGKGKPKHCDDGGDEG